MRSLHGEAPGELLALPDVRGDAREPSLCGVTLPDHHPVPADRTTTPGVLAMSARGRRGEYVANHELRYVYRCAGCWAARHVSFGRTSAPVRLLDKLPPGWAILECESMDPADRNAPVLFWLCSACAETPEESRALAVMRHPIRIVS